MGNDLLDKYAACTKKWPTLSAGRRYTLFLEAKRILGDENPFLKFTTETQIREDYSAYHRQRRQKTQRNSPTASRNKPRNRHLSEEDNDSDDDERDEYNRKILIDQARSFEKKFKKSQERVAALEFQVEDLQEQIEQLKEQAKESQDKYEATTRKLQKAMKRLESEQRKEQRARESTDTKVQQLENEVARERELRLKSEQECQLLRERLQKISSVLQVE
jgi:predicted RNase H-like nuclease (RuvC/YqgF family)